MITTKPIFLDDTEASGTGIYHTVGLVAVKAILADGTINEAVYGMLNTAGTPSVVLLTGNSTQFGVATGTDTKTNLDFNSGQLRLTNQTGQSGEFHVQVIAGV
jgi:hypothetical protein